MNEVLPPFWIYEQSIDKASGFIGSLKHTHFVCALHSHKESGAYFSRFMQYENFRDLDECHLERLP